MLCRHCYQDIGVFGKKPHNCDGKPEKRYMEKPSKKAREIEREVYKKKGQPKS